MYESPININYGKMNVQLEGAILKAVQEIGVTVDKEELLAALQYDRNQYCKGYGDAFMEEDVVRVVLCKDCISFGLNGKCALLDIAMAGDDFCSYGERREGE